MDKIEITPELLAELKEKAEKATPAWLGTGGDEIYFDKPMTRILATQCVVGYAEKNDDAEYIAAANPSVVLALIARIEELEANNYGPEILNDPQALTASYFAGRMAEDREKNAGFEILEKEADWLASQLSKCETDSEYTLPFCPYELDKQPEYCDYDEKLAYDASCDGEMPCTHKIEECWRGAARKAVEENSK